MKSAEHNPSVSNLQSVLQAAYEPLETGVFVIDQDNTVYLANAAACKITGFSPTQLRNFPAKNLVVPDDWERFHNAIRGKETGAFHLRLAHSNDRPIKVSMRVRPFQPGDGQDPLAVCQIIDLTPGETPSRQSVLLEKQTEALFEQSPLGIAVVNRDRQLVQINDTYARILGYEKAELLGKSVTDIHPDQREIAKIEQGIHQLNPGGNQFVEAIFVRKDGQRIWCEICVSLLEIDGDIFIQGILRDLSREKEAERRAKARETKLETILKAVDARIFHLTKDGILTYSNQDQGRMIYGDFVGRSIFSFSRTPKEDKMVRDAFRTCRETKQAVEYHVTTPGEDQQPRYMLIRVNPVLGEAEEVTGFTMVRSDITSLRLAHDALRESQGQLQSILDTVHARIWLLDDQFQIRFVNRTPNWTTRPTLLGLDFFEVIADLGKVEQYRDIFSQIRQNQQMLEFQETIHVNGLSPVTNLIQVSPVLADGAVKGYTIVVNNITPIREAYDQIQKSESRFRSIVEGSDARITTVSLDDRVQYMSKPIPGFTTEEVVGLSLKDYMVQDQFAAYLKRKEQVLATGKAISYEDGFTFPNGETRYIFAVLSPITREDEIIGLTFITRDITDSKELEIKHLEALEVARAAIDATGLGIYEWDIAGAGKIVWDDNVHRIFGLEPGEFEGNLDHFSRFVHPDDAAWVKEEIETAISHRDMSNAVHRIIRKDGEVRWLNTRRIITRDVNGKAIHLKGVAWDVTAEKQQEESAVKAARLEAQNQELKEFTYIASHDLQSPLRTVSNYADLLAEEYSDVLGEEGKFYIDVITNGVLRMRGLIMDLLDYSRISQQKEREITDLNHELASLLRDLKSLIQETGARITVGEMPTIPAFRTALLLMFQNLITNAIKFQPPGNIPEVVIGVNETPESWIFFVKDNGIGIKPEYQKKIFQVFQRLHTREEFEGTGIGLAHCEKVARLHGGEITVESTEGQGSTFRISIPKEPPQDIQL